MKSVVIVAAGSSVRFGANKLACQVFDKSLLQHTVDIFKGIVDEIVVVGNVQVDGAIVVPGGETRSQSVRNGLDALSPNCTLVAVHDGARPFVSRTLVETLFAEAEKFGSAVPSLPVCDTLWQSNQGPTRCDRNNFFTVQTPQVFRRDELVAAFENSELSYTDESTLYFEFFGNVHFVQGEFSNKKVTYPADLPTFRIGVGFDVHAFEEGNGVLLGGVVVPYNKKLKGHSDADVLAHAVCDAVLSASSNRDIGVQFPDTDDSYLGANSLQLLSTCVSLAKNNGFEVENVSAVIVCQQPKLAAHLDKMAQNLAEVLHVAPNCVNLSATTTEHLGALGNGDGIAVEARALLSRKC